MKKPPAICAGIVFAIGLMFLPHAPAQELTDEQVMLQAVEATTPTPAANLPAAGNFYSAQHAPGSADAWPPFPSSFGHSAWGLGSNIFLLDDLTVSYGAPAVRSGSLSARSGGMSLMSLDVPGVPGDGDGDTNYSGGGAPSAIVPIDTNSLWLQIFCLTNGTAYLALNNATDSVYEIFSTVTLTNGSNHWSIETELWPSNTNSMPFTAPEGDRTNSLFFWARDWAGVTSGGNQTPEWFFWKFYGTVALSDTNLDSTMNHTLLYDYTNGLDPNVIQFSIGVTNNYVNTGTPNLSLNILGGVPSYYAVVVDGSTTTNWTAYTSSTITAYLGSLEGWHDIWIGLKGLPSDAQQTWVWKRLKLDVTSPPLVITSPTNSTVNMPVIQLTGYSPEQLAAISYDLSNAVAIVTNQQALITDQSYSTNTFEFTTNWFQGFDVGITNGVNTITLHATDLAGNVTTTNFSFTLDYSGKTNPPVIQLIWPQNGMKVCGGSFIWNGWVSDPTATVAAQTVDTSGATNVFNAAVGRDGKFWVQNLPLNSGTNNFTLTVTDVATNIATTNLTVIQGDAGLTINPITPNQTTVTGGINSTNCTIWVNGVQAVITGNTWEADDVPIPPNSSLVQVTAIPNGGGL